MPTSHAHLLDRAADHIETGYVFPERATEIASALRSRVADGVYDGLSGRELCEKVTADLQEVCPDRHLRLRWSDEPQSTEPAEADEGRAAMLETLRRENHGVRRVERLDGNTGYIDLRRVTEAGAGGFAIGAAMQLVAGTDALVLDLRACSGGAPSGAALWCSHFFPDDATHLNDIYDRGTDSTRQFWTSAHLPAPRYLDRPVYVLTSADTFSGGEDIAYTLQAHERAVVVGERTRGGAHPTAWHTLSAHITVTVPTARTVSPVTGTNWEGTGVTPDTPAPAAEALDTALATIRERADAPAPGQ
ncbi:S41 family peptidase [Streptomyces sp. DSM 42041]|uniref:S41 family peptidase n=1 Tax=Streptomyces hazeniae TaxID=3075538 RepID=A0ABU2NZJ3_9ACTN|nr:S41 family peptidase [Streptomyces sp. DSM 42041]MDT0382105.1 S41 family peptidase [Streptomyces sp. DSM 42041]